MKATELAQYTINKCYDEGHPISHLQLQYILMAVKKTFLQEEQISPFPERIERWRFGPVVPEVYRLYGRYGRRKITKDRNFEIIAPSFYLENRYYLDRIDAIIAEWRCKSVRELVSLGTAAVTRLTGQSPSYQDDANQRGFLWN